MIKIFTHDDLVRYLYRETTDLEEKELEEALLCNPQLMDSFSELKKAMAGIDGLLVEPSARVVDNILHYSKAFSCHSLNN